MVGESKQAGSEGDHLGDQDASGPARQLACLGKEAIVPFPQKPETQPLPGTPGPLGFTFIHGCPPTVPLCALLEPRPHPPQHHGHWWIAAAYATQTYMAKEPSAPTARRPTIKRYGSSQAETRTSHTDDGIRVLGRLSYVVPLGMSPPAVYLGPGSCSCRGQEKLCFAAANVKGTCRSQWDYIRTWKRQAERSMDSNEHSIR